MKKLIGLIFTLLILTASHVKSQNGTTDRKIIINEKENYFQAYPLSDLYEWHKLQIRVDSLIAKEVYYKNIINTQNKAIVELKTSNKDLNQLPLVYKKKEDEYKIEIGELKNKNLKKGIVIGGLTIGVLLETWLLIK